MAKSVRECTKGELKVEAIDANINKGTYLIKWLFQTLQITNTAVDTSLFSVKVLIPVNKLLNASGQVGFRAIAGIVG